MNSLFGNSNYSGQISRLIENGTHGLSGSDKYLDYDRTNGNIILNLPRLSTFLDENSKSGNALSLSYILSDLTSLPTLNTLTLVCDINDNINGQASVIPQANTSYSLQATPAGWLLVNQVGTQTKGIFNNTGSAFNNQDYSNEDFTPYTEVIISNPVLGVDLVVNGSGILKYFTAATPTIIQSATFNKNSNLIGMGITDCSSLLTLDLSDNPLLQIVKVMAQGMFATNPLSAVNISNCPLLNDVNFSKNSLSQANVDSILSYLDSTGVANGNLLLNGGANSAPTGGAGNANLLSLIAKGWVVSTN